MIRKTANFTAKADLLDTLLPRDGTGIDPVSNLCLRVAMGSLYEVVGPNGIPLNTPTFYFTFRNGAASEVGSGFHATDYAIEFNTDGLPVCPTLDGAVGIGNIADAFFARHGEEIAAAVLSALSTDPSKLAAFTRRNYSLPSENPLAGLLAMLGGK